MFPSTEGRGLNGPAAIHFMEEEEDKIHGLTLYIDPRKIISSANPSGDASWEGKPNINSSKWR